MSHKQILVLAFIGLVSIIFLSTTIAQTNLEQNSVASYLKQLNAQLVGKTITTQPVVQTTDHSILFSENAINSSCINSILKTSLAKETGEIFYTLGKEYNINPAFALALFRQESSLCNTTVTGSSDFIGCKNKSIGNITCTTSSCYKGFNTYASWEEGIKAVYSQLKNGSYYIKAGNTTIESIYPKWANVTTNSVEMKNILSFYTEYNSLAGKTC